MPVNPHRSENRRKVIAKAEMFKDSLMQQKIAGFRKNCHRIENLRFTAGGGGKIQQFPDQAIDSAGFVSRAFDKIPGYTTGNILL